MRPRNIIIAACAVVILFALAAMFVIKKAEHSRASIEVYGHVPQFEFTERSGAEFGLENLKGSLNVVDFIFTKCPGACPVMSGEMVKLYKLYEGSDKVRFVSISVDPDTDTLPVLTEYAESYGVTDDRWVFLRGQIEEVINLSEKGFMLAASNLPQGHSTKFVLVDHEGKIRGYYDSYDDDSIKVLKEHLRALAKQVS